MEKRGEREIEEWVRVFRTKEERAMNSHNEHTRTQRQPEEQSRHLAGNIGANSKPEHALWLVCIWQRILCCARIGGTFKKKQKEVGGHLWKGD